MPIKMIKSTVDDMNIETSMYYNGHYDDKPISVRVRDLDANENVSTVICPNMEMAEKKYDEAVNGNI